MSEAVENPIAAAAQHSKAQILKSKQFTPVQKDFLVSLLDEDEKYSLDDVGKMLGDFLRQEVE